MNAKRWVAMLAIALCACGMCRAGSAPKEHRSLASLPGDVRGVVFSPNGKWVAVSTGLAIKMWEWETGKVMEPAIDGGTNPSFSIDNALLAFPGQNEFFNDGLMIRDIALAKKKDFIQDDNVQAPVFSPDGKSIYAAVGNIVKAWELAGVKEMPALKDGHKCSINAIVFISNGKMLVSADGKGTLVRWDVSDQSKKAEFKRQGNDAPIYSLAATREGKLIAASTGDGEILVLDGATLALAGPIKGHKDGLRVKSVAFAPDNRMLASACSGVEDLEVKLWDAVARTPIVAFTGHQGGVNCVAFSPDGKWLVTGSDDKTAKIWEVAALLALNAPKPEKKKEEPKENK